MFTNILVPLDGSAQSNAALPLARTVARSTGARITLLRVVRRDAEAKDGAVEQRLEAIAAELREAAVSTSVVVRKAANVADEILRQVQAQSVGLVIMRTHGRAGIERAILGSVTQGVLARSQVPILVLRPGERRVTHIRKLLVPVDGSPGGSLALGTAVQLAKETGAHVQLFEISVPASQWVYADAYGDMSYYDPAWDQEALESAQEYVTGVVRRLKMGGVEAEGAAQQARGVADCIVNAAQAAETDLIVMSTRALTGPSRAILGSTADAVIRAAHCPVLLVHRPDDADVVASEFEPVSVSATSA